MIAADIAITNRSQIMDTIMVVTDKMITSKAIVRTQLTHYILILNPLRKVVSIVRKMMTMIPRIARN